MTPAQRAQRRHDLLLAAHLLRRQVDADLVHLQPSADRVLVWLDAALWLRRQWARSRASRLGTALAAAAAIAGVGGLGAAVLRHGHWLQSALVAWRAWQQRRA
ncbi:MAG TPA: hypothetical protein VI032_09865 [Burkholderiaceae bacterium]